MTLGPITGEKPANHNNDRWMDLCEKAAAEHDSEKLHQLILEIDRLLEEAYSKKESSALASPINPSDFAVSNFFHNGD